VLSLAAFIAVLLVGWYFWGPAGGKLTVLNEGSLTQFDSNSILPPLASASCSFSP